MHSAAAAAAAAKSLQSCLTLCDPIDGLLPGSPVPGVLQARTLEWVAISFSKFLPYNYVNQLYIYIYPLPFESLFSHTLFFFLFFNFLFCLGV